MRVSVSAATVALATVVAISGCTPAGPVDPDPTAAPDPTAETPATYGGDPLADLSFTETALATAPTADTESRTDVLGLTDSRLLTTKPESLENVIILEALDVQSGQLAWDITLTESRQLAIDTGLDVVRDGRSTGRLELAEATVQRAGGDAVFVPVFGNTCVDETCSNRSDISSAEEGYTSGVVALNAEDGSLLWSSDLTPHLGDHVDVIGVHPRVVDANAELALVNVVGQTGEGSAAVVALDTASGEVRWSRDGVVATSIAGDVVTAVTPVDPRDPVGDLVGLDAATGEELWSAGASGSWIPGAARGNLAAVSIPEADIVDLRTGEFVRMGRFPVEPVVGTAGEGAFVAWLGDIGLISHDDGDDGLLIGEERPDGDALVAASDDGYLWVATAGDDPRLVPADRTGHPRADPLPGTLIDVRAGSVATLTPDGVAHLWRYFAD